jgi:hypothetical protein
MTTGIWRSSSSTTTSSISKLSSSDANNDKDTGNKHNKNINKIKGGGHNNNVKNVIRYQIQKVQRFINEIITGDVRRPSTRFVQQVLYWITAADSVHSVFLNEYSELYLSFCSPIPVDRGALVPSVYSKLFYFARLRPRLLYAIGALVRALQLCTPFRKVLDPCVGVGAGVNLCALLAGSRWVKPFVLGWATTKWVRIIIARDCILFFIW